MLCLNVSLCISEHFPGQTERVLILNKWNVYAEQMSLSCCISLCRLLILSFPVARAFNCTLSLSLRLPVPEGSFARMRVCVWKYCERKFYYSNRNTNFKCELMSSINILFLKLTVPKTGTGKMEYEMRYTNRMGKVKHSTRIANYSTNRNKKNGKVMYNVEQHFVYKRGFV